LFLEKNNLLARFFTASENPEAFTQLWWAFDAGESLLKSIEMYIINSRLNPSVLESLYSYRLAYGFIPTLLDLTESIDFIEQKSGATTSKRLLWWLFTANQEEMLALPRVSQDWVLLKELYQYGGGSDRDVLMLLDSYRDEAVLEAIEKNLDVILKKKSKSKSLQTSSSFRYLAESQRLKPWLKKKHSKKSLHEEDLSETEEDHDCAVCYESVQGDHYTCEHGSEPVTLCRGCLEQWIKSSVMSGQVPIRCPAAGCKSVLHPSEVAPFGIPVWLLIRWKKTMLLQLSEQNWEKEKLSWRQCPGVDCPNKFIIPYEKYGLFHLKSRAPKKVHKHCQVCGFQGCLDCGFDHKGSKNCMTIDQLSLEYFEKNFADGTMKLCPGCGAVIEKNKGCKHMTCRRCKKEFHWDDLSPWEGSNWYDSRRAVYSDTDKIRERMKQKKK